jgi:hypothetical protein
VMQQAHKCRVSGKEIALTMQQEVRYMKKLSLLILGMLIVGCAEAVTPADHPAVQASSASMIVTGEHAVPGHSQYVTLGTVQAKCLENSALGHLTASDLIADANGLKQAAYRTYGSQADAIVDADVFYVIDYAERFPLLDQQGHLECEGTAIHFQEQNPALMAARSH